MIVVIPSNRSIELDQLEPLIDSGARFIVVDDTEGSIRIDHPQFEVYDWGDRRRMLGPLDVGFPRRNGAARDVGFWIAWRDSDPGEIVVALDDDCAVYHDDYADRVKRALSDDPRPVATTPGTHLNICQLYRDVSPSLHPRGFPYSQRAADAPVTFGPEESREVVFSLGMWTGVFDVNAVDKIEGPDYVHEDATLHHDSVLVETGRLVSVCSMNMQFRREVIPAVYQLPMHVPVMPGWVVDRYGDIWGGFILKSLLDLTGDAMAVGEPMIHHLKAGDYTRNIWQEHICHLLNDEFLALLDDTVGDIRSRDYLTMVQELTDGFRARTADASPLLATYLDHCTTSMAAWTAALAGF